MANGQGPQSEADYFIETAAPVIAEPKMMGMSHPALVGGGGTPAAPSAIGPVSLAPGAQAPAEQGGIWETYSATQGPTKTAAQIDDATRAAAEMQPYMRTVGTNWRSTRGLPLGMSGPVLGQMAKITGEAGDVQAKAAEWAQGRMLEQAKAYSTLRERTKKLMTEHEADASKIRSNIEAQMGEAKGLMKDLRGMKVDPERWWSSRSAGQKVGLVVAAALGGFVQGFSNGKIPNTAIRMMENAINRDIMAQRANIAAKRGQLQDVRGLVAMYYNQMGDLRMATNMAQAQYWRMFETQIGESTKKLQGEQQIFSAEVARLMAKRKEKEALLNAMAVSYGQRSAGGTRQLYDPRAAKMAQLKAAMQLKMMAQNMKLGEMKMAEQYRPPETARESADKVGNAMLRYLDWWDKYKTLDGWGKGFGALQEKGKIALTEGGALFKQRAQIAKEWATMMEKGKLTDFDVDIEMRALPGLDAGPAAQMLHWTKVLGVVRALNNTANRYEREGKDVSGLRKNAAMILKRAGIPGNPFAFQKPEQPTGPQGDPMSPEQLRAGQF